MIVKPQQVITIESLFAASAYPCSVHSLAG